MGKIQDILDSLYNKNVCSLDDMRSALNLAYWRGVTHALTNPNDMRTEQNKIKHNCKGE